jgi:general secretion pathway protein E
MAVTDLPSQPLLDDASPSAESRGPLISYAFARRHGIVVTDLLPDRVVLRCRRNASAQALAEVLRVAQRQPELEEVDDTEFDQLLSLHYEQNASQAMQMMDDLGPIQDLDSVASQLAEPEDLLATDDEAPVIRLLNALLAQAVREQASDIHIEPLEKLASFRFRVDGVLRQVLTTPRELMPILVSRIKVMAHLDIAEKRLPQDGRLSLRISEHIVDVRVSTLPANHGERVVLRLLDKKANQLVLEQLGMADDTHRRMDRLIRQPHGILLVTGPTGSGKTTTLYASLSELDRDRLNILTVEDPVEYELRGIGQTQVNPKVDLTFARGLRAILRQDPDVVMVGEIRDLETAQIAVQASLTGHLVLSTLHTNSAVGAITRLRDMGIEPFMISSTLIGVLAQRLVRLLCEHCKQPYEANEHDLGVLGLSEGSSATLYRPVGCPQCQQNGYQGRNGIFELIDIDGHLRQLVHDDVGEPEIERYVRTRTPSIREDGLRLVLTGRTSLEEVVRVTRESS